MPKCLDCNQSKYYCDCPNLVDLYEEDVELGRDLEELVESTKSNAKRCIICLNFICRCSEGHAERLKRG